MGAFAAIAIRAFERVFFCHLGIENPCFIKGF